MYNVYACVAGIQVYAMCIQVRSAFDFNIFLSIFRDYLFADITYDRRRYDRIDTSCM